ncbi:MAG: hypothetical protein KME12_16945 [Trichocoleus desertorum ATA4-8-CV12]|jgi:hypothetical protein|nr:hypothetical protein [Trichocoleus desertorum ATA4-8-CV12]
MPGYEQAGSSDVSLDAVVLSQCEREAIAVYGVSTCVTRGDRAATSPGHIGRIALERDKRGYQC